MFLFKYYLIKIIVIVLKDLKMENVNEESIKFIIVKSYKLG